MHEYLSVYSLYEILAYMLCVTYLLHCSMDDNKFRDDLTFNTSITLLNSALMLLNFLICLGPSLFLLFSILYYPDRTERFSRSYKGLCTICDLANYQSVVDMYSEVKV